jgi:PAS domain S-box-containing protein
MSSYSLRSKVLLGYAFIFLLVSVFNYAYSTYIHKQQAIWAVESKIGNFVDMMAMGVGMGLGESNTAAISEVRKWARKDSALTYMVVLNQDKEQVSLYQANKDQINIGQLLKLPNGFEDNRIIHFQKPLVYQDKLFGILLIGYSLQSLDQGILIQKEINLYICLGIFGFGLILSIILSARFTSDIIRLNKEVNNVAESNSQMQVSVSGDDEIRNLAEAFNNMIYKLNQSRDELLLSNQYTENIIMSMLDSLLVLDPAHRIAKANRAVCQLLEYAPLEILGKNIVEFFQMKSFPSTFLPILEQVGYLQGIESQLATKSGKVIDILFSASILRDRWGAHQGIVCVVQDISERKKAEIQLKEYFHKLEKSSQEMEKFNYVVSHDLKAPLRALFKLSEWIEEDAESTFSQESRRNFHLLRGRVSRMEALINGLLAYSQTGRLIKLPELVNVTQILQEIALSMAFSNNIAFCIGPDMPCFVTQRKCLQQIFVHLISNAIRFNDKPEIRVRVAVTELEKEYKFSVEDNGAGIEPQYYEKIFVIFQTLQARDHTESTGIGLTIARKIVEEHHGKIWVESVVGEGSVFMFTWPK